MRRKRAPRRASHNGGVGAEWDQNETARDWQLMFISVPIILLIEMLFATWSWQKLRSLTRRRHYAKPVAALFFASISRIIGTLINISCQSRAVSF